MSVGFTTAPGQTLEDRFVLLEEIAHGGMATIYKASDLHRKDTLVAVKVPLAKYSSGLGSWSLCQREAEIGRQLDHPNIVKFLPLCERRPYLVMEYVPGSTLASRLLTVGVLPEAEALAVARQIVSALRHMHERGFVHYDLKPENVIMRKDGTVCLIDLGLAHAVARRFTLATALPAIGSPGYVSPEQIKCKGGRISADIYGLGAVFYELLTGKHPFPGDDPFVIGSARLVGDPTAPRKLNPDLSRELEEIVLRALRRDPNQRYLSMAAMESDLDSPKNIVITDLHSRLKPVTGWRRRIRQARYIALTVLVPIALQVAAFFLIWQSLAHKR